MQGYAYDFSEKGQKRAKQGKIFKNLGKNVQNLKKKLKKGKWLRAIIADNRLLE